MHDHIFFTAGDKGAKDKAYGRPVVADVHNILFRRASLDMLRRPDGQLAHNAGEYDNAGP